MLDLIHPLRYGALYKRITLDPGQKQEVTFTLKADDLSFYNQAMKNVAEPGKFKVWIGKNAAEGLESTFELK